MSCKVIATGSSGNAVLVDRVLFDCGVPWKLLKDEEFDVVCLTHEHGDHFKPSTIKAVAENKPLVTFVVPYYLVDMVLECVPKARILPIEPRVTYRFDGKELECFELKHDVPNVGYVYGRTMYATDTGSMEGLDENQFKDLDLYLIEANYKEDELRERIAKKEAAGEYCYEYRVSGTHLSQEQAERFILKNAGDKSRIVYLHEHGGDK